jgi:hypothetical protein
MQGTVTSRGKRIYRCIRRHAGGRCPSPARVDAELVERAAERAFWAITDDLVARGREDDKGEALARLTAELERAERRLAQAMTPEMQGAAGEGWPELVKGAARSATGPPKRSGTPGPSKKTAWPSPKSRPCALCGGA